MVISSVGGGGGPTRRILRAQHECNALNLYLNPQSFTLMQPLKGCSKLLIMQKTPVLAPVAQSQHICTACKYYSIKNTVAASHYDPEIVIYLQFNSIQRQKYTRAKGKTAPSKYNYAPDITRMEATDLIVFSFCSLLCVSCLCCLY